MKELKHINIPSLKLTAGGKLFHISYTLSTVRYVEYLKRVPKLAFGATFRELYDTLGKIYMACASGNDVIYAIQQAKELSWNQLQAIKKFDENEIPDIIDFCCLFINETDEDPSHFSVGVHEAKKQLIHQEGYSIESFFSLAYNLIESLDAAYQKIQSLENQSGPKDLTLPSNTLQTNPTS